MLMLMLKFEGVMLWSYPRMVSIYSVGFGRERGPRPLNKRELKPRTHIRLGSGGQVVVDGISLSYAVISPAH